MSDLFDNIMKNLKPILGFIWERAIYPFLVFIFTLHPFIKIGIILIFLIMTILLLYWIIKNKDEMVNGVMY
jgi:hypothetical protein